MVIKRWLAGGVLGLALAASLSGAVGESAGQDAINGNIHIGGMASNGRTTQDAKTGDPDDGGQVFVVAGGDLPVITHVSHVVALAFGGTPVRYRSLDPCLCDNPVCRPACRPRVVAGVPDDGGQVRVVALPEPDGTPIIRD